MRWTESMLRVAQRFGVGPNPLHARGELRERLNIWSSWRGVISTNRLISDDFKAQTNTPFYKVLC